MREINGIEIKFTAYTLDFKWRERGGGGGELKGKFSSGTEF